MGPQEAFVLLRSAQFSAYWAASSNAYHGGNCQVWQGSKGHGGGGKASEDAVFSSMLWW